MVSDLGKLREVWEVREVAHLRLLGGERPLDRDVLLLQPLGVALERGQLRFERADRRWGWRFACLVWLSMLLFGLAVPERRILGPRFEKSKRCEKLHRHQKEKTLQSLRPTRKSQG